MSAHVTLRSLGAAGLVAALVAGCAASATPAPSATASPAASAATPAPSIAPETAGPATPSAPPTPEPPPTAVPVTPAPGGSWAAAGTLPDSMFSLVGVRLGEDGALAISGDALTVTRWDPATGAWRAAAPLNAERREFAAVTLADGRALVVGGVDTREPERWRSYSSAYVFDGSTERGTWTKVGLMGTARTAPATALLPDGRVLVAGGAFIDGSPWGAIDTDGVTLASVRRTPDGTTGTDGRILEDVAAPGIGRALATAEILDPATGSWTPTGSMHFARAGAAAVTLADGRVLVVGPGSLETGSFRAVMDPRVFWTAEVYDPATGGFTLVGRIPPIDREAIAADGVAVPATEPYSTSVGTLVALGDGGALLVGANDFWKYEASVTRSFRFDPATAEWTQVGPAYGSSADWSAGEATWAYTPGEDLAGAHAGILPGGQVLVAGGSTTDPKTGDWTASATARAWDPATGGWALLPSMPQGRQGGSTAVLGDGSILLVGGAWTEDGGDTAVRFVPAS